MGLTTEQKRERQEGLRDLRITVKRDRQAYVFVSYKSEDWRVVFENKIIPLQKQYNLRVYADKEFDNNNDSWVDQMKRNLKSSKGVIIFVSDDYITSYATYIELLYAISEKKPIIPVYLTESISKLESSSLDYKIEMNENEKALLDIIGTNLKLDSDAPGATTEVKTAYRSFNNIGMDLMAGKLSVEDFSEEFIDLLDNAGFQDNSVSSSLDSLYRTIRSVNVEVFGEGTAVSNEVSNAEKISDQKEREITEHRIQKESKQKNEKNSEREVKNTVKQKGEQKLGENLKYQNAYAVSNGTGGLRVVRGSVIKKKVADTCPNNIKKARESAIQNHDIEETVDGYVLLKDIEFKSLSGAACFVSGGSVNGKLAWKVWDGALPDYQVLNSFSTTQNQKSEEEHSMTSEKKQNTVSKKGKPGNEITYTVYGKQYTTNQTDMLLIIASQILERHPDCLSVADAGTCFISLTDYSKVDRADRPNYFSNMNTAVINGTTISVGGSFGKEAKIKEIIKLIKICSETEDCVTVEGQKLNLSAGRGK